MQASSAWASPRLIVGRTGCWSVDFVPEESEVPVSILHPRFLEGTVVSAKTTATGADHVADHVALHVADVAWFWAWIWLVGGSQRGLCDLNLLCFAAAFPIIRGLGKEL